MTDFSDPGWWLVWLVTAMLGIAVGRLLVDLLRMQKRLKRQRQRRGRHR
jgi:hypothetical protein